MMSTRNRFFAAISFVVVLSAAATVPTALLAAEGKFPEVINL